MKKNIIWSGKVNTEDYSMDDYKEWCEMNGINPTDDGFTQWCYDSVSVWLDDEKCNLNVGCGKILALVDLNLWNGHRKGYKVFTDRVLSSILDMAQGNEDEFYCDAYNVCANIPHHDGTNHFVFREIKNGVNIDNLLNRIFDEKEISSSLLSKYTRSLRPKVAKIYGWK